MFNSSYKELLRGLEPTNSFLEAMRHTQATYDQFRQAIKPFEDKSLFLLAQQQFKEVSPAIEAYREFEKSIFASQRIQDQLNQISKLYSSPSFSLAQEALKTIQPHIRIVEMFDRDLAFTRSLELFNQATPSLINIIEKASSDFDATLENTEVDKKEIVASIEGSLEEVANQIISSLKETKAPIQTRLFIGFLLIFVWPTLSSYYFYCLGNKDNEKIYKVLSRIEREIEKSHEQIKNKIFYKVIRNVWLTEEQTFQKGRILELFPGQEVEVLDFDGKWVYVAALSLHDNTVYEGWVLKKYLKKLTTKIEKPSLLNVTET